MSIAEIEKYAINALCDKIRESGQESLQAVNDIYCHELGYKVDKITLEGMIDTKGRLHKWADIRCPQFTDLVHEFLK